MLITDKNVKQHVDTIMDCFTGVDGGVSFAKLAMMLNGISTQAAEGSESAKQLLEIVRMFAKIIEIANNPQFEIDNSTTK